MGLFDQPVAPVIKLANVHRECYGIYLCPHKVHLEEFLADMGDGCLSSVRIGIEIGHHTQEKLTALTNVYIPDPTAEFTELQTA